MRVFSFLAGLLILGNSPILAADDHDECKQQIQRLQERLELVEEKLAVLLAAEPPTAAVTRAQNVALPAIRSTRETTPPELLPEIGKIGAEVGLVLSGSANPFHLNNGQDAAGFIDLPMFEPAAIHGKISYEIRIGLSQAKTKFQTTSNVAQVANLTALTAVNPSVPVQNLIDSVTGTGAAPFPVTSLTETRSKLLQVIPFSLKYTTTSLDRFRLRPYGVLGFGTYVTIHSQSPVTLASGVRTDSTLPPDVLALVLKQFSGTAPFGGLLVGGQLAQSPQLTARGLPLGTGNIDFGLHMGGGVEFRMSPNLSLGFDGRYNRISGGQTLGTFGTRLGFHF